MLSKQIEDYLMASFVEAIVHTNEVYTRHVKARRIPDAAQMTGEFVTSLRRAFKVRDNKTIESWCSGICKTDAWTYYTDCRFVPLASWGDGHWTANIPLSDGSVFTMNLTKARDMLAQAGIRAKYASEKDLEEADLVIRLRDLEMGVRNLNSTIGVAASLNQEADAVVSSLCTIAEKLVS